MQRKLLPLATPAPVHGALGFESSMDGPRRPSEHHPSLSESAVYGPRPAQGVALGRTMAARNQTDACAAAAPSRAAPSPGHCGSTSHTHAKFTPKFGHYLSRSEVLDGDVNSNP